MTYAERWNATMMPNYGTPPIALDHGHGVRVWDTDGNEYLDFVAGIAVSSLGHAHPAVVDAVTEQVGRIAHTSNLYMHEPGLALAERLVSLVGAPARVFFGNSGAEANECALKLVRKHGQGSGRAEVIRWWLLPRRARWPSSGTPASARRWNNPTPRRTRPRR